MDDKLIIAKNIKMLREANRFTQDNVAKFLGIGRSAYSNYELGTREIPLDILEKLTDLYGVDLYLLFEENETAVKNMLVTAFRIDDLSQEDLNAIAVFKRIVKNYIKLDMLLQK